ncbi:MAG: sigma-54-dependent Fis family transcriptional regulator [Holophagaceae bacterium]|nr:sigma-54-dependent Fis family transcriptional regulator [Holophagaceae bacterium]
MARRRQARLDPPAVRDWSRRPTGTLFLEGIGDMDPGLQERLLTTLEAKQHSRAGEDQDQRVDVRLIAATHQHLDVDLRWGRLRCDLYLRFNTIVLNVPPLRKRVDDIPLLAEAFLEAIGREAGRPGLALTEEALHEMGSHRWHGNLRELRNVIERAVLHCPGAEIRAGDLQLGASSSEATPNYGTRIELAEIERLHIRRVLEEEGGRIEDAARRLDMPQQLLLNRLRKSEDR